MLPNAAPVSQACFSGRGEAVVVTRFARSAEFSFLSDRQDRRVVTCRVAKPTGDVPATLLHQPPDEQPTSTLLRSKDNSTSKAPQRLPLDPAPPLSERDAQQLLLLAGTTAWLLGTVADLAGLEDTYRPALLGVALGTAFCVLGRYALARLWRRPSQPLRVVVTGGTRGLGKALAREHLAAGDHVLITGRSEAAVQTAIAELVEDAEGGHNVPGGSARARAGALPALQRLHGVVCDSCSASDVSSLAGRAVAALGGVDLWLQNAATSGGYGAFLEASDQQLETVVRTNLLGAMLAAKAALTVMAGQPRGGHLVLIDGAGADGAATPQFAAYGATKAGLVQLAASLRKEQAEAARGAGTAGAAPVGIHIASPGMMVTDLLLAGTPPGLAPAFNILCEHPETVAAYLVPRLRSAVARGLSGTYHKYLTGPKAMYRFLTAPSRAGRFFDSQGQPVYPDERERIRGAKHAKRTERSLQAARDRGGGLRLAYSLALTLSVALLLLQ